MDDYPRKNKAEPTAMTPAMLSVRPKTNINKAAKRRDALCNRDGDAEDDRVALRALHERNASMEDIPARRQDAAKVAGNRDHLRSLGVSGAVSCSK